MFMDQGNRIRCVAGILVGGRSTRMGRPKALLPLLDGRRLVEHVADVAGRLTPWIEETVILGCGLELPRSLGGLRRLADQEPGAGPLGGLCALLGYADMRWSLLLACDLPRLQPALLKRLFAAAGADSDAVAFRRSDRPDSWHACCALYHPRFLPAALRELQHGRRCLQTPLASEAVATLEPSPEEEHMLADLNHREDYDFLFSAECREAPRSPMDRWEPAQF
jgi:molybdopterin-guanine dinucleotide biosynthesis protein A